MTGLEAISVSNSPSQSAMHPVAYGRLFAGWSPEMPQAQTLREVFQVCDPAQPLPSGNPFFVELSVARSSRATENLRERIESSIGAGQFASIVFSGHRGSGKSTELHQLEQLLSKTCFSLHLDVNDFLDPADVDYTDLFLLISRRLLDALAENGIALSKRLLQAVENWFATVTKETEETIKLSAGVAVDAKAGLEIPFISRLLAKLTADIKAGSSKKLTTRQELDQYFSGLLSNTNLLLTAAADALKQGGQPFQILIVFDQLDRLPPEKSEKLFFSHGSQLQGLQCHALYTVSIDTFYSRHGIANIFHQREFLPNVKLRFGRLDHSRNEPGIRALVQVIGKRINRERLLSPPSLDVDFVLLSGGSVRQLIRLLRDAALSARTRGLSAIDPEALEDAARGIQQDFERTLEPDHYPLLAKTAKFTEIEKDEPHMLLLRNMAILEYDGKDLWYDVNPLIGPIDAFKTAAKKPKERARAASSKGARGKSAKKPPGKPKRSR
jgi:hypothetical protein